MSDISQMLPYYITTYGFSLLGAILIFIIGRWIARWLANLAGKFMSKTDVDETLSKFVINLTYVALLVFVKPFKVGDLIEAGGAFGTVEEIQIFNTIILTPDNKTIIVPNAQVTGGNITNISAKGILRLDLIFGIGYNDDLLKAKQVLEELIASDERALKDPAPTVAVLELGDSSVNFAARPFVKVEDYWDLHFALTEQVKLRFDKEGISIPYPQQDVHLHQVK